MSKYYCQDCKREIELSYKNKHEQSKKHKKNSLNFEIEKSNAKNKKLTATNLNTGKKIHFGDVRYMDFILYNKKGHPKAEEKRKQYIKRHEKNEDWSDLTKAGTWSRFILWNEKTLQSSIDNMEKRFSINITNKARNHAPDFS